MKGPVGYAGLGFVLALAIGIHVDVQANSVRVEQQRIEKERLQSIVEGAQAPFIREPLGQELHRETTSMVSWPEETPSFLVSSIEVKSDEAVFRGYDHAIFMYTNRKMGAKGMQMVAKALQDRLLQDGYVTSRVEVPSQDLRSGKLVLRVIPGYIEDVVYRKTPSWGTAKYAMPLRIGRVLNMRDVEQGIDQLRRIPGYEVNVELLPGTKPDGSVIAFTLENKKPIHLGLSIDDSGQPSTGVWNATADVTVSNPLGVADVLSYSYGKDLAHEDSKLGNGQERWSYSIPYGKYTFSVGRTKSKYHQTIAGVSPYVASGTTKGTSLTVDRLVRRDSTRKTNAYVTMSKLARDSFVDGERIGVQEQRTTTFETGIVHSGRNGRTQFSWKGYYRKGIGAWDAKEQEFEGVDGNPTSRYAVWGVQGSIETPVKVGAKEGRYTLQVVGQYTTNQLYTVDGISIGGRYTVRGFSGSRTLSGDYGFYVRNELSLPLEQGRITPYVGLDYGYVNGPSTEWQVGHHLAGAVMGVRGRRSSLMVDAFVGVPLYQPVGFGSKRRVAGVAMYMNY